jgi:hypothetical protein
MKNHKQTNGLSERTEPPGIVVVAPVRPALLSIPTACEYLGGLSRAKFYADILPFLETVKFGNRNLVVLASLDRLIASRSLPCAPQEARDVAR